MQILNILKDVEPTEPRTHEVITEKKQIPSSNCDSYPIGLRFDYYLQFVSYVLCTCAEIGIVVIFSDLLAAMSKHSLDPLPLRLGDFLFKILAILFYPS